MTIHAFRVSGTVPMGRMRTKFTIETVGADEEAARDRVMSTIGSRHRVARRFVKIDNVQEISRDEVTDSVIEHRLEVGA